jgi:hypothetical protein
VSARAHPHAHTGASNRARPRVIGECAQGVCASGVCARVRGVCPGRGTLVAVVWDALNEVARGGEGVEWCDNWREGGRERGRVPFG